MSTMRAAVIEATGEPEVLHVAEVERPHRVGAELLIKVQAAGVNPIDFKTRAGKASATAFAGYPVILGSDFSGVVVETSYRYHPIAVGDDVFGMTMVPRFAGSYAEYLTVPSTCLARKPASLTALEAAAVPLAALTAWGAVVDVAKAHEGQRMLIHAGAGGVGHFAVQFARFFGAQVITTASARNADWLLELGAHQVIDYTQTRFEEAVEDLDVVIDLIGNVTADTATRSLKTLRPGGLIVNVPSGSWPTMVPEAEAAGVRATDYRVPADGTRLETIARMIDNGDVRVHVDKVYDLADVAEAHRQLEHGHTRGKIVLDVSAG